MDWPGLKYGKKVPTKKIIVQDTINIEVLKKLILLNNTFIQYHVIPYKETIMIVNDENIIYFEMDTNKIHLTNHLLELNRLILLCCNNKSILKTDMEVANRMWKVLCDASKLGK